MTFDIIPLDRDHLPDAAALVAASYRALRAEAPCLPARYGNTDPILSLLADLAPHFPGVAALRGGQLVGFLLAMVIPEWRGKRSAWSPEWANAAEPEVSRPIYRAMYARLSEQWVADRTYTHLVSLLAHDREAREAWHWQGFGLAAVDAARDLTPVLATPGQVDAARDLTPVLATPGQVDAARSLTPVADAAATVDVRRAGMEDVEVTMVLDQALHRYLAGPPIFLFDEEDEGWEEHERRLADAANALWLAYDGPEAVAYMIFAPANEDACTLIQDPGTASIVGAYTRTGKRGAGVGTALLDAGLTWAREAGYERCAVDFEPENIAGSRFWLRYFQPVCYSLVRHVDERVG